MNKTTQQSTRVRTAREEQTRDCANMPVAQIQHGYDQWSADVEIDGDELVRLRRTTVLEDPRDLPDREVNGQMVTPVARLERTERGVRVTPNIGVDLDQAQADSLAERFILDGQLEAESAAIVYPLMELARPAPFDQGAGEPEYRPVNTLMVHESEHVVLELPEARAERFMFMESQRPDWTVDPDVDMWGSVMVRGKGSSGPTEVEVCADTPEELHALARFFTAAANQLQATQDAVKAARAETGVTA